MDSFTDWKATQQLDEARTSKQHADRVSKSIAAGGGTITKYKEGGEHGEHKFHHVAADGDRWVTTVKGETTTTRPATRAEAIHFTAPAKAEPAAAPAAKPSPKKEVKPSPKK